MNCSRQLKLFFSLTPVERLTCQQSTMCVHSVFACSAIDSELQIMIGDVYFTVTLFLSFCDMDKYSGRRRNRKKSCNFPLSEFSLDCFSAQYSGLSVLWRVLKKKQVAENGDIQGN